MGRPEDLGNEIVKARNYLSYADQLLRPLPSGNVLDLMVSRGGRDEVAGQLEAKWGAPASNDPRDYVFRARDTLERLSRLDPDSEVAIEMLNEKVSGRLGPALNKALAWLHATEAEIAFLDRDRNQAIHFMEEALRFDRAETWAKRLEFFRFAPIAEQTAAAKPKKKWWWSR